MKRIKRIWPVVFSLFMLVFAAFLAWQIYAVSSVKARTAEAEDDLKRQQGMLKQQQVESEKALTEIRYYQDMLDDLQPEYDVVISKKAQKKSLGDRLKELNGNDENEDDEGEDDDIEYEEVDDEDEEEDTDENF